jgi:hypothetical protein
MTRKALARRIAELVFSLKIACQGSRDNDYGNWDKNRLAPQSLLFIAPVSMSKARVIAALIFG